jgi:deoxyribonuclease-4
MKLGSHLSFKNSVSKILGDSVLMGQNVFQFFLGNTMSLKRSVITDSDLDMYQKLSWSIKNEINERTGKEYGNIYAFSHFPYTVNLCGSTTCLAWNGNHEQDEKTLFSIKCIEQELLEMKKIDGGVVLHVGSFKNKKLGCETVAKSLNLINFAEKTNLIIENMAGQGTVLCSTFEEMKYIYDLVSSEKQDNISFCIDTAHIFGSGIYDLRLVAEIDRMFEDINCILDIKKIALFHINDSKAEFKSKKDRHALIGEGLIWKDNLDSFRYLMKKIENLQIPAVLETDPTDFSKVFDIIN